MSFIESSVQPPAARPSPEGRYGFGEYWGRQWALFPRRRRLQATLRAMLVELDTRAADGPLLGAPIAELVRRPAPRAGAHGAIGPGHPAHVAMLRAVLREAKRAMLDGDDESAWALIHQAVRHDVAVAGPDALRAAAARLDDEARGKLRGWRRRHVHRACEAAVELVRAGRLADARVRVADAMRVRDEHFANVYAGIATGRAQVVALCTSVAALLALLLALAVARPAEVAWLVARPDGALRVPSANAALTLAQVMLFGVLGAMFSGAIHRSRAPGRPLPEQLGDWTSIIARPLLGATAAVIVLVVAQAGTAGVTVESPAALLLLCFASGFSERLVIRFLDKDEPPPAPDAARGAAADVDDDAGGVPEEFGRTGRPRAAAAGHGAARRDAVDTRRAARDAVFTARPPGAPLLDRRTSERSSGHRDAARHVSARHNGGRPGKRRGS